MSFTKSLAARSADVGASQVCHLPKSLATRSAGVGGVSSVFSLVNYQCIF